ncbi:NADH dehydrogenase [ubiquinone] 1 beta subcomplex subunit 6 [Amyelois transitella]|uniref:NADH dehydrogenase [ubiquinone] 1 beta subcomplex subunit 6 n=1 Tax=Amyelois transitella TaxID=680683 RepID=UPI00067BF146|nr:NADH dehydrogenase [ubiquinone] 1 beta subcomplex subunit 6 [Amyelois transitella]
MAQTAGVKPMTIAGRVAIERERCLGMTDAERAWRKQWLKDQILAPHEPVHVEEYWRERINPIRRFYRKPLDTLFNMLMPALGQERAINYRYLTGKFCMLAVGVFATHYYFKYNGNDWTKQGGWRVMKTKPTVLPGQPGFPFKSERKEHADYADRGFKKSALYC